MAAMRLGQNCFLETFEIRVAIGELELLKRHAGLVMAKKPAAFDNDGLGADAAHASNRRRRSSVS